MNHRKKIINKLKKYSKYKQLPLYQWHQDEAATTSVDVDLFIDCNADFNDWIIEERWRRSTNNQAWTSFLAKPPNLSSNVFWFVSSRFGRCSCGTGLQSTKVLLWLCFVYFPNIKNILWKIGTRRIEHDQKNGNFY